MLLGRWLDHASNKRQDRDLTYKKIVLVVDDVDSYLDVAGKEESPGWLPFILPPGIKAVYTASSKSKAMKYLLAKSKSLIEIEPAKVENRLAILNAHLEQYEIGEKLIMKDRIEMV